MQSSKIKSDFKNSSLKELETSISNLNQSDYQSLYFLKEILSHLKKKIESTDEVDGNIFRDCKRISNIAKLIIPPIKPQPKKPKKDIVKTDGKEWLEMDILNRGIGNQSEAYKDEKRKDNKELKSKDNKHNNQKLKKQVLAQIELFQKKISARSINLNQEKPLSRPSKGIFSFFEKSVDKILGNTIGSLEATIELNNELKQLNNELKKSKEKHPPALKNEISIAVANFTNNIKKYYETEFTMRQRGNSEVSAGYMATMIAEETSVLVHKLRSIAEKIRKTKKGTLVTHINNVGFVVLLLQERTNKLVEKLISNKQLNDTGKLRDKLFYELRRLYNHKAIIENRRHHSQQLIRDLHNCLHKLYYPHIDSIAKRETNEIAIYIKNVLRRIDFYLTKMDAEPKIKKVIYVCFGNYLLKKTKKLLKSLSEEHTSIVKALQPTMQDMEKILNQLSPSPKSISSFSIDKMKTNIQLFNFIKKIEQLTELNDSLEFYRKYREPIWRNNNRIISGSARACFDNSEKYRRSRRELLNDIKSVQHRALKEKLHKALENAMNKTIKRTQNIKQTHKNTKIASVLEAVVEYIGELSSTINSIKTDYERNVFIIKHQSSSNKKLKEGGLHRNIKKIEGKIADIMTSLRGLVFNLVMKSTLFEQGAIKDAFIEDLSRVNRHPYDHGGYWKHYELTTLVELENGRMAPRRQVR